MQRYISFAVPVEEGFDAAVPNKVPALELLMLVLLAPNKVPAEEFVLEPKEVLFALAPNKVPAEDCVFAINDYCLMFYILCILIIFTCCTKRHIGLIC